MTVVALLPVFIVWRIAKVPLRGGNLDMEDVEDKPS